MAPLTPEQVWKLLGEQFPDLRTEGVERLDTGGEHYTFAVGNDLIFRFPRDAATAAKTAREVALLAELAPVLPLPVPTVRYLGRLSAWFPYLFTGQQRIAGVMGEVLRPPQEHWPQLAEQLGAFFSALHAFTVERAAGIGIRSRPLEAPEVLIADTVHYRPLIERACPELVSGPAAPYLRGDVLVPPPASLPLVMSHA
ncbi:MAG: phosphotransferase, partial [Chloroflexota bacterium]